MTRIIEFIKASWRSNGILPQLFHGLAETQVNELLELAVQLMEVNGKTLGRTCEELVGELKPSESCKPNCKEGRNYGASTIPQGLNQSGNVGGSAGTNC